MESMVKWIYSLFVLFGCTVNTQQVTVLSRTKQRERLFAAMLECNRTLSSRNSSLTGRYCRGLWDNVMCWNDTPADKVAIQHCPYYIHGFDSDEFASKTCLPDGTWYSHNNSGRPWTNYTACGKSVLEPVDPLIAEHMPRVKLMYTIGYSVSLAFLILAVAIMIYFKRLHCPRNVIHLNLFFAMLLRATISLLKGVLLVQDVGFPVDVTFTSTGKVVFLDGPHWECRLFFSFFNYSLLASLFWIFNEGLYLQLILSISVFADKTKIRWFVFLGWGSPVLFVTIWSIVRLYQDNTMCWNVHDNPLIFWIIRGPMVVSVLVNFIFFMNIVRLLFTKLTASNCHESRRFRYRRLAKSTLILIPLFAVYYMVFIWLPRDMGSIGNLIKLYVELVFNSFQGFFIAMLFCFLNAEVQSEIKKKWQRRVLGHTSSIAGRSFASIHTTHRLSKQHDTSPLSYAKTSNDSADYTRHEGQNGYLLPINEETVPLRRLPDVNCNNTVQSLQNGDSRPQTDDPMIRRDG